MKVSLGSYCGAICNHCLCTSKMDLSIAPRHSLTKTMHTFSNLFSQGGFWATRNRDGRSPQTTYTYDLNPYKGMAKNMERPINQSAPHTHLNVITATENLMQESFLRSMHLSVSVLITNCFSGSAKWQYPRKKERSNKLRNLFIVQFESRISEKKKRPTKTEEQQSLGTF